MPEPVSIALGCWLGYNALNASARPRSAFSRAAEDIVREFVTVMDTTERSQVLYGRTTDVLAQLRELADECANPDWDGNGANPLDEIALQNAEAFIRVVPEDLPMPDLAPEPDGSISLDWIASQHRRFSVSVGTDHRIAYAWLDGVEKGHAVAVFDGRNLPARLQNGIASIFGHANTAFGSV